MAESKILRVFISSPSDVRPERLIAERVARRLGREFAYHFRVEPVLWEREPLTASQHFQDQITPPRETDIVVVILWSRLGVPLPTDKFLGPLTGKPVTGTEWEFEDALKGNRERKLPDLLMYRKRTPLSGSFEDEAAVRQQLAQKRLVEEFIKSWFIDQDAQSFTAAFREFTDAAAFEEMLETHLRELLRKRLAKPDDELVPAGIRWHQGSPFRGLLSFELEHAPVFFGRTRARNELRELLARQVARGSAFVLVVGASGSGKSSLVKAGLLADLQLQGMVGQVALVRHAVLRPSDGSTDLLGALAAAIMSPTALPELAALQCDHATLKESAARCPGPGQAADQARAGGSRPDGRVDRDRRGAVAADRRSAGGAVHARRRGRARARRVRGGIGGAGDERPGMGDRHHAVGLLRSSGDGCRGCWRCPAARPAMSWRRPSRLKSPRSSCSRPARRDCASRWTPAAPLRSTR